MKRYAVIDAGGLKVGLFAVIGGDAAEVAPFASPVSFRPVAEVAKELVSLLREREKADLVVCISHSGLWDDPEASEDELLAKAVPGIDVIISGHTHTRMDRPRVVAGTIIVQAWEKGKQLGVLDLAVDAGKVTLESWRALAVDDATPGDWLVQGAVEAAITEIDRAVLAPHGLAYRQVIAETSADMPMENDETGLGNLVADAIRWHANAAVAGSDDPTPVAVAFESNGIIHDDIRKGATGRVQASDLFRVLPLGVGMDGTMSYPLIGVYLTAGEIKKALEIVTSIYPMKGSDYFLQCSGLRFAYNPNRILFDRVTRIDLGSEEDGVDPARVLTVEHGALPDHGELLQRHVPQDRRQLHLPRAGDRAQGPGRDADRRPDDRAPRRRPLHPRGPGAEVVGRPGGVRRDLPRHRRGRRSGRARKVPCEGRQEPPGTELEPGVARLARLVGDVGRDRRRGGRAPARHPPDRPRREDRASAPPPARGAEPVTRMDLKDLVEISRRYGTDEFALAGGGNTSCKDGETLAVKASGARLRTIGEDGFVLLRRSDLAAMLGRAYDADPFRGRRRSSATCSRPGSTPSGAAGRRSRRRCTTW